MTTTTSAAPTMTPEQATWFKDVFARIVENVENVVLGKTHILRLAFTTLLSEGHLLLEDFPGTGKTSLARAIAQTVKGTSNRIQFTPDLLPGDVTGMSMYDQKNGVFEFHEGPVFANVLLADEINRASPKTQSALLEVMEESRVTIDGITHSVPQPFMVIATQNPIEQAGTYRLPEAQLDRFLMKTSLGRPDAVSTRTILAGARIKSHQRVIPAVLTVENMMTMIQIAKLPNVDPTIIDYIARLVDATHTATEVRLGVSIRGALGLTRAAMTWAAAAGRTYVLPDDVKMLAEPVLAHRLVLDPEAEFDGVTASAVVGQVLLDVLPPVEKGTA
jgi:MoxR-like ATPase